MGLRPVGLVLIAIASVQLGATFAKGIFESAHPATLAFLRAAIATSILALITHPDIRGRSVWDWVLVTGYGLCLSGMNLFIYLSFSRIPIGVAVTLEFIGPLAVAALGSRRIVDLVWVAFAAVGVVLLGAGPLGVDLVGALCALLAGALWGAYIAIAGPVGRAWNSTSGLTVGSAIGALALLVPGIAFAGEGLGKSSVWAVMTVVALLSTVVPYTLELQARRMLKASTFGILMSLEPAGAAILAWLVLRESLSAVQWLAMACIIVASGATIRAAAREPVETGRAKGHN